MDNHAHSLAALKIDQGPSTHNLTTTFVQHLASPWHRCRVPLVIYIRETVPTCLLISSVDLKAVLLHLEASWCINLSFVLSYFPTFARPPWRLVRKVATTIVRCHGVSGL